MCDPVRFFCSEASKAQLILSQWVYEGRPCWPVVNCRPSFRGRLCDGGNYRSRFQSVYINHHSDTRSWLTFWIKSLPTPLPCTRGFPYLEQPSMMAASHANKPYLGLIHPFIPYVLGCSKHLHSTPHPPHGVLPRQLPLLEHLPRQLLHQLLQLPRQLPPPTELQPAA
jgi:hypothetical protein